MGCPRRNTLWSRFSRRFIAAIALVAYVFSSAGVLPLPAASNKKKHGVPFPCQDDPCGCSSAEECWRHCCCYSVEEHWAWAAAHNVEPPEYAERPAHGGWSTVRERDRDAGQTTEASVCPHCEGTAPPMSSATRAACCETERAAKLERPAAPVVVRWFSALHCQGLAAAWMTSGAVLPLFNTVSAPLDDRLIARLIHINATPVALPLIPPDPPPRAWDSTSG
jgi:hypothetical protein